MQALRLKPRQPVEDEIENWDDDDFLVDGDDLNLRRTSNATTATTNAPSGRRDSTSSHLSLRSELESWNGEEETQVHIPGDDEASTLDAIAAAQNAGIPLPSNVPSSALMGGTIKRLGGRKLRKIIQEDWENDLELPDSPAALKIKQPDQTSFPETLRQTSGGSSATGSPTKLRNSPMLIQPDRRISGQPSQTTINLDKFKDDDDDGFSTGSPTKLRKSPMLIRPDRRINSAQASTSMLSSAINLDKFKDDDDDDFFGDGGDTIKVAKKRQQPISLITPPTPQRLVSSTKPDTIVEDDFENDLELPSDGKLKLSTRRDIPKTPNSHAEDMDWGEGSLGTRYGGTRRDARSARSSSASALSPSVSSTMTGESEDETFDGLVLPTGPVNFQERLKQRRSYSRSPNRADLTSHPKPTPEPKKTQTPVAEADHPDFLDGLDFGDDEAFNPGKLTLHRNIQVKDTRPASPARPKAAVSLTFTNKPAVNTRIPRLNHERSHSTSLEPVSESGGPIQQRARRPASRLGHSAQSSTSSIPTPSTPSSTTSPTHSTPKRREIGPKTSTPSLRNEPTTTSAQLLKSKRSLPAIRALNPPTRSYVSRTGRPGSSGGRPGSSGDGDRPVSALRPRTPVERQRSTAVGESPGTAYSKRNTMPFLPAGASLTQSQHKTLRQFRRHDSDNSIDSRSHTRTFSSSSLRSPSPGKPRLDTWERLSRPRTRKQFGDGHELDGFDDLPTSRDSETKFMKQPLASGPKLALRNKLYQNVMPDRTGTPSPTTPASPARTPGYTPHFARDTAASRRARETSLANRPPPTNGPLATLNAQRLQQQSTRANIATPTPHLPHGSIRSKKTKRPPQLKPHLISNLNAGKESKMVNGMYYNADTFQWEGNENALNVFEPMSTPTAATPTLMKDKEAQTPRPALITNISATKGVQVVGGMVFDPEAMCWLKIGPQSNAAKSDISDPLENFNGMSDEEDVFKDIPDLDDAPGANESSGVRSSRVSDIKDEWLVGEEFDVGPEFIRRQREEEDRWRKKCEKWTSRAPRDREAWRWTIRELVSQFDDLAV